MKILMLTCEYPQEKVEGIAKIVDSLSKELAKKGHEITIVTYQGENLPEYENDNGISIYRVPNYMINPNNFIDWTMQLNFNMIAKISQIINKQGIFDVIHAHDWLVTYTAKTVKNSYNIPIVATIHTTENERSGGIRNENQKYINDTEWLLTYEASEVMVNKDFVREDLKRLFGLPSKKIKILSKNIYLSTYPVYEKAICKTIEENKKQQTEQQKQTKKIKKTEISITNLSNSNIKQVYA